MLSFNLVHLRKKYVVVVQSLICFWLFVTPQTAACQDSLFFTISQILLKLMSIELVMSSIHVVFYHPRLLPPIIPTSGSFIRSQFFASGGQSIGASASALVLPMNIQDWFPLRLTGVISFQSKGHSRFFSNMTVLKHQVFGTQASLWCNSHIHTWLLEKP